jgi:hypothetical protein
MSDIDEMFGSDVLLTEPDPDLVDAPVDENFEPVEDAAPEPSTGRRSTRTAGKGRGRRTKSESLNELKNLLADEAYKFGGIVSPLLPTTGAYMIAESEEAMRGIVDLAKDNPRALDALRQVAKAAPGIVVGRVVVGIGTSVLVDARKIAPDAVPARMLGVTRAWAATHEKEANERGIYVADPVPVQDFTEL